MIKFKKVVEVDIQNKMAMGRKLKQTSTQNKQLKDKALDQQREEEIRLLTNNSSNLKHELKKIDFAGYRGGTMTSQQT